MSQTTVQRSKALRFGSVTLERSLDNGATWLNLGALKNAKMEVKTKVSEIMFDNAKLPPREKIDEAVFTAVLAEVNLQNIYDLNSQGVITLTPASSVPVPAEVIQASGTWAQGATVFLAFHNGDGSPNTITNLKNGATTLTAGTDYQVVVIGGQTGFVRLGSNLTLTGIGLNSTYAYTPNASTDIVYRDVLESLALARFRMMNTDEDGKKFGIEIYEGYNKAGLSLEFKSDEDVENVMELPIEIKAYPVAGTKNLFKLYDEQDV